MDEKERGNNSFAPWTLCVRNKGAYKKETLVPLAAHLLPRREGPCSEPTSTARMASLPYLYDFQMAACVTDCPRTLVQA